LGGIVPLCSRASDKTPTFCVGADFARAVKLAYAIKGSGAPAWGGAEWHVTQYCCIIAVISHGRPSPAVDPPPSVALPVVPALLWLALPALLTLLAPPAAVSGPEVDDPQLAVVAKSAINASEAFRMDSPCL
jgi:hypothetical protein